METTEQETENHNYANIGITVLMVIAGLASGLMSLQGAQELLDNYFLSIPFAIVVQGAIITALLLMPKQAFSIKLLLSFIWAVAASFSIGSAYLVSTEADTTKSSSINARNEITVFISQIESKGASIAGAMNAAANEAARQLDPTKVKNAGPGQLFSNATALEAKLKSDLKVFENTAGKATQKLRDFMDGIDDSTNIEDLRAVYEKHVSVIPAQYLGDVETPIFISNAVTATSRMSDLWTILKGDDDAQAKFKITFSLFVASIMEALALLLGLARFAIGNERDPRNLHERFVDFLAKIKMQEKLPELVASHSEINIAMEQARIEEKRRKVEERKALLPKKRVKSSRSKTTESAAVTMWKTAIKSDADIHNVGVEQLIREILTVFGKVNKDGEELFSAKDFNKNPLVMRAFIETKVLQPMQNALLRRGQNWGEMVSCLSSELASQPKSSSKIHLVKTGT